MPHHLKIYLVFHESQLKSYVEDKEDVDRGQSNHAQIFFTPTVEKQIKAIIDHQLIRGNVWGNSSTSYLFIGRNATG